MLACKNGAMSLLERITGTEVAEESADEHSVSSVFAEILDFRGTFQQFLEDTDSLG